MILEFQRDGFNNAITVCKRTDNVLTLKTHLVRQSMPALLVYSDINLSYEKLKEEVQKTVKGLHPDDFFLNPEGFKIDIQDDWYDLVGSAPVYFKDPTQITFLGGIRFNVPEEIQKVKAFGQFEATKLKINVEVGNSTRPTAKIWKGENEYFFEPFRGDQRLLPNQEDLIREVIRLSRIHQNDKAFFDKREQYIRETLPGLFK